MLEWLWPWVFAVAPLPWLIHRFSKGESLQPSALRAPFAARCMDDADRRLREATVDRRTH